MIRSKFSRITSGCIAMLLLAMPKTVSACSVCFGKSDSKLAEGMNWGIVTLLVVVGFVLTAIASFFVYIARRSASMTTAGYSASIPESTEKI